MASLHFQVIPTAFVVAYENDRGELVAVSEHGSATTAAREAYQRNAQSKAQHRAAKAATSASTTRQHHAARCFEPDAFA